MNMVCLIFAAVFSTGVEIPEEGVPIVDGWRYSMRTKHYKSPQMYYELSYLGLYRVNLCVNSPKSI